jgi:hypothetical protein
VGQFEFAVCESKELLNECMIKQKRAWVKEGLERRWVRKREESLDSPSCGFAILYHCTVEGRTSGDTPTSWSRPLPPKHATHAGNTGCRTVACVPAGRQRLHGIIARHVQLRSGRCVEIWVFAAPARFYCCAGHWRTGAIMRVIHGRLEPGGL